MARNFNIMSISSKTVLQLLRLMGYLRHNNIICMLGSPDQIAKSGAKQEAQFGK